MASSISHEVSEHDHGTRPLGTQEESAGSLLARLVHEMTTLLRKEVALAKAEINESIAKVKTSIFAMIAGGAVLFAGAMVTLAGIVLLLAEFIAPWLAALIVGALLALVGYLMLLGGKEKLDMGALKPERTQESLRKDREMITRRVS